jgi:hypothetical protein
VAGALALEAAQKNLSGRVEHNPEVSDDGHTEVSFSRRIDGAPPSAPHILHKLQVIHKFLFWLFLPCVWRKGDVSESFHRDNHQLLRPLHK